MTTKKSKFESTGEIKDINLRTTWLKGSRVIVRSLHNFLDVNPEMLDKTIGLLLDEEGNAYYQSHPITIVLRVAVQQLGRW